MKLICSNDTKYTAHKKSDGKNTASNKQGIDGYNLSS